jgi:aldehyde:ferredoxin oxidoreductase
MSKTLKGYAGKQLRLILGEKRAVIEPLYEEFIRDFLGGTGYAARLLFREQRAGMDPLDPESRMVLATGPLTMNKIPGGGSVELCFKSPLTRGWGESRAGSDFGPDMRRAGFDFIIIEGKAEIPLYVVIRDENVEFRPAAHLRGKTVSEKQRIIRAELPEGSFSVGCIGPAGENLVKFANVMFEQRAAGRGGAGAVFGVKNLLGIAVSGSGEVEVSDPDRLRTVLRKASQTLRDNPMATGFRESGTIGDLPGNDDSGDWPTKNWQSNSWGKATELFDYYQTHNFIGPYPCYRGCVISCGRKVHVPGGCHQTPEHGGAEYESISCFTAYVLNEDMDAAVHSTYLCNEYGIDTISAGSAIAFAVECAEQGLLTAEDLGGVDLRWGNGAVLPELVKMIALRRGIGDTLAEGVRSMAEKLGKEAERFAVHVKGLEGPAHDPRSGKALALSYGTGNRGMCHIHPVEAMAWDSGKMTWGLEEYGLADPEAVDRWAEKGKGREVKLLQDGLSLPDILGTCKFFMYAGITVAAWAEMMSALTGREVSALDLLAVSERVYTLQRLFNLREGMSGKDDAIPRRAISVPALGKYAGEEACATRDYETMLREYYTARGWNANTGVPTKETLQRLGLGNI